jgi:hypothetical protein
MVSRRIKTTAIKRMKCGGYNKPKGTKKGGKK